MNLNQEFTNETGRCPDNDVQYYADWLEEKVEKLTTPNSSSCSSSDALPKLPSFDSVYVHAKNLTGGGCEPSVKQFYKSLKELGNFA